MDHLFTLYLMTRFPRLPRKFSAHIKVAIFQKYNSIQSASVCTRMYRIVLDGMCIFSEWYRRKEEQGSDCEFRAQLWIQYTYVGVEEYLRNMTLGFSTTQVWEIRTPFQKRFHWIIFLMIIRSHKLLKWQRFKLLKLTYNLAFCLSLRGLWSLQLVTIIQQLLNHIAKDISWAVLQTPAPPTIISVVIRNC